MNRNKVLGNISISCIIIAIIFCIGEPDGKSIGYYIFNFIGIPRWSNGNIGLYYPSVFALILLFIGIIGAKIFYVSIKPRYIILVLIIAAVSQNVYMFSKDFVKAHSSGLNAIEYLEKDSNINYKIDSHDKSVKLNTTIYLINHGNKSLEFQVDMKPCEKTIKDIFKEDLEIDVTDIKFNKQQDYTIAPNGNLTIKTECEASIDGFKKSGASGTINGPDIILKNNEQQVEFSGVRR